MRRTSESVRNKNEDTLQRVHPLEFLEKSEVKLSVHLAI